MFFSCRYHSKTAVDIYRVNHPKAQIPATTANTIAAISLTPFLWLCLYCNRSFFGCQAEKRIIFDFVYDVQFFARSFYDLEMIPRGHCNPYI